LPRRRAYDLKDRSLVEINSKEGLRNLRIVVGTKAFVENNSGGVDLLPKTMTLFQNYPNPFNPETVVRYTVPGTKPSYKVTLKVYNILGQEVATLVKGEQKAGYYEVTFSGKGISSGPYFYWINVTDGTKESSFTAVKKMILLK
jgi:flagellar hook assembly protein FlgD